jgi:hypothetical protein
MSKMPTSDTGAADDLALDYFRIGNGTVAFHVAQTILFLNAIYKAKELKNALIKGHAIFQEGAWGFALLYTFVIAGCAAMEFYLRASTHAPRSILISTGFATAGRLVVVLALTLVCGWILGLVH